MLKVINLECVRGERSLFKDVNFSLEAGELLQVNGPNGSGKTSLLRMLCGLARPAHGEIRWLGDNIRSLDEDYYNSITYLGHLNGVKDILTQSRIYGSRVLWQGMELMKARPILPYRKWVSSGVKYYLLKFYLKGSVGE